MNSTTLPPSLRFILFIFIIRFISVFWGPHRFSLSTYDFISLKDYERHLRISVKRVRNNNNTLPLCPKLTDNGFRGRGTNNLKLTGTFWTLEDSEENLDEKWIQTLGIKLGGSWSSTVCRPIHHVAIIIPFRERMIQLKKFSKYMHHFLQLQLVSYKIYVIEQSDDLPFNRGKLFNVGYNVALREDPELECFIFHDVDLLPESLQNIYGCGWNPRHMSGTTNSFRYTLLYPTLFGGAISISREIFASVNGFSNNFYGWGGEDDNFYDRMTSKGIHIIRLSPAISSYRMLPHKKAAASSERINLLKFGESQHDVDGLNSLKYTLLNHISGPLYTLIQTYRWVTIYQ